MSRRLGLVRPREGRQAAGSGVNDDAPYMCFEFQGVEFRVNYQQRVGWVVRGDRSYIKLWKIHKTSPKVARFVLSVVAEKKCCDGNECVRQLKEGVGAADVITGGMLPKLPTSIKTPRLRT